MKNKSLYKTISWRLFSILSDVVILNIFFDGWKIGVFVLVSQSMKTIAYYGHEKLYKWIKRRKIK